MTLQRLQHVGAAPPTTLNGAITSGSTSLVVQNGAGYPDGSIGPFYIKVYVPLANGLTSNEEKILCLNRSGNTINVVSSPSTGRGADNTSAAAHANGETVEHCFAAAEADDDNDHVYTTTRDDHTQYALVTGTRHFTGQVQVSSGGLIVAGGATVSSGNITASAGGVIASGSVTAGSGVNPARCLGTIAGIPSTGSGLIGDYYFDPTNSVIWLCTTAGSPGTWEQLAGLTDQTYTAVSVFTNSWVAFGGSEFAPGFRLLNGRVWLRGCMKSGTIGSAAFTLPSGYRPTATIQMPCQSNNAYGSVQIVSTGVVTPNVGSNVSFFLDGVSFDTLS